MHCQTQSKAGVILHSGAIGDCLLTLPLAEYLKKTYALNRLDFIGPSEYIGFYPQRTCIDVVHSIETVGLHRLFEDAGSFEFEDNDRLRTIFGRYEQIISLLGSDHPSFENNLLFTVHSIRSADVTFIPAKPDSDLVMHVADYYLEIFKHEQQLDNALKAETTTIQPLPEDYHIGGDILEQAGIEPDQTVVVIAPGSGSREKCWHWENFVRVAFDLRANGLHPVFLWGPAEKERFEDSALQTIHQFPVLDNLSLTNVLQVLTQADVFLGNDSGIGHLAAGMGRKTVVLFGSGNPVQYAPRGENVLLLQPSQDSFQRPEPNAQAVITQTLLEML